jgi:hypothetical protein
MTRSFERVVASVVCAVLACVAASCSSAKEVASPSKPVVVKSGIYHGVSWRLYAWTDDQQQFCMQVRRVTQGRQRDMAAACVFDDQPAKGSYYYASGPGPQRSGVNFGPLPTNAVAVRIATHQTVPTYPFPPGGGLPEGRFWVDFEPATWPAPAEGKPLHTPQPLDRGGKRVAFQTF